MALLQKIKEKLGFGTGGDDSGSDDGETTVTVEHGSANDTDDDAAVGPEADGAETAESETPESETPESGTPESVAPESVALGSEASEATDDDDVVDMGEADDGVDIDDTADEADSATVADAADDSRVVEDAEDEDVTAGEDGVTIEEATGDTAADEHVLDDSEDEADPEIPDAEVDDEAAEVDDEAADTPGDEGTSTELIKGIGPAYAERLAEIDIHSVEALAAADVAAVAEGASVGESRAATWIDRAQEF